ncbi:hypothetical protein PHET_04708 [Paragonimus heterotremus]|uniref:Uncharacterized protein n=1 Tax=Paragonimus heterotremus TaxID=100268 RepID=A0A8J4WH34_9TREM|nr:hypothetical protein PHET_04708 [Paragonimus heterotremus]
MSETDEPSEVELTQTERDRIASNRDLAVQLRLSQVVANDRNVVAPVRSTNFHRTQLGKGGFIPDIEEKVVTPQFEKDEELTDDECDGQKRTKRRRVKRVASTVKDRLNVSPSSIDVAERALSIWGTEDQLESERTRRVQRIETAKLKQYNKKIKELKVQTRSSLFMKTHATHQHNFGPETYDETNDVYMKRCTDCEYVTTFEKL